MNTAIDKVISALNARECRPKRSGTGFTSRCPAHEDRNPSLSVTEGTDGRTLVHCHAGCRVDDIARALGLEVSDLFANGPGGQSERSSRSKRIVSTRNEAANPRKTASPRATSTWQAAMPPTLGTPSMFWEYHNADGEIVQVVARWDRPDGGKEIRPAAVAPGGGWLGRATPEPRPMYNLPSVISADRLFVVEGEKCVDALISLGLTATTSSLGAKAADKTDWTPLAGKQVIILPDHDDAGEDYARDVTRLAAEAGAKSVSVVRLTDHWADCPAGGDVADWVSASGDAAEPADIRAALEAIVANAEPMAAEAIDDAVEEDESPWVPFPVNALPEPLATFVNEAAAAIGVDPSMVALPLLAMIAGAIGNTRRLVVKSGWSIPPILWTCVISESGSGKTPAFREVTEFTNYAQSKAFVSHEAAMAEHELALANYELQLKDRAKRGGVAPQKPERPAARRLIVADTTVEALVPILRENPRGVVLALDELAGWFTSHDAYRAGGRGGVDRPKWLNTYDAGPVTVDRKTSGTVHVPSAAVSITGGVQPAIMRTLLTPDNLTSGLVPRFMLAMPPCQRRRWSEDTISFATRDEIANLFRLLLDGLPVGDIATDGPKELDLDPEAKDAFRQFAEHVYAQQAAASGVAATMLSKLPALAGRLALVIHVSRQAGREPALGDRVDVDSIRRGTAIALWAGAEQQRVYRLLIAGGGVDEASDDAVKLGRWLAARGGRASDRDISKGLGRFRDDEARADAAVARLVAEGRAIRETTATGGRPSKGIRLVGEAFGAFGAGAA